jgi:hypothetical protein
MKKILVPLGVLILGTGVGGGAAFGTSMIVGGKEHGAASAAAAPEATSFVPADKVIAPLVMADGRLAGYVSFEVQLQVPTDKVEEVTAKLPLLLHAINMRTYHTPMAAGPDGMLPDIGVFRKVVEDAGSEAFGPGVLRKAAVTQAEPA